MASQTNKSSAVKSKSSSANLDGSSSITKKRAAESSIRQSVDAKQRSVTKTEVKEKSTSASSSKTVTKTVTKTIQKREKKVFSLPGQKYDPPEEREPLRIFYESLSRQIPSSEMAEFWMMEHGLLSPERAKRAFEKKQRKQKQQRMGTPVKSPQPPSRSALISKSESSKRHVQQQQPPKNGEAKEKKRIVDDSDDDDDDDFVLSHKRRKG